VKKGLRHLPAKKENMELANSTEVKGEQATQNGARAAIEAYTSKSDERIGPGSNPVSQKRHLDVDAVLARSVRKVVSE
jgi:hypothetical protein